MTIDYRYDVQLPSSYDPEKKYPAIFALHGLGSNEKNMMGLLDGLKDDFIVIGVRGNLSQGSGYAYFHIKSIGNPIREHFDQSIRELERFIRCATDKYAIDPGRRYLLGFSQGAILSMSLALVMGEQLKGIVALNGYIPAFVQHEYPHQSVKNMSVFISHGEYDPVFPQQLGDANHAYFRGLSNHVTYKTYAAAHEVTSDNRRDFTLWLLQDANNNR
ncbi:MULTISPECIES: alpha/beta hydrolase [Paenibacillus]|uniref:Esterase n=1 Tax=Paenibacillus validus TaxID=44253 RepID=A0A7X2ZCZ2_9BACL|nr:MULTISPECIES: alpha/beta hydrolase-fold protein [Paenibacillus]MUG71836.1 esterase [Paenibacillus validus]